MTWSSRGSSEKCGILLAHSTRVKSCLSAAWQMFVTGSLGWWRKEEHKRWVSGPNVNCTYSQCHWLSTCRYYQCFKQSIRCVMMSHLYDFQKYEVYARMLMVMVTEFKSYTPPNITVTPCTHTHNGRWQICSERERTGRQNKQCFCPNQCRKYLQRAAVKKWPSPSMRFLQEVPWTRISHVRPFLNTF